MKTNQLLKTILAGFLMTLCGVLTGYAQWAKLDPNELSLAVGETKSVTVKFDESYSETSVTWTFLGRTSIINRVDEGTENATTIEVKALAEGETFVACEVHGKKGSQTRTQSFVCNVNVTATAPTALSLPAGMTVKPGETMLLTPTVTPEGASTANLEWSSSDETIATVSEGVVTGVKPGNVQITVKTKDGSVSATCEVKVSAVDPTAISLPAKVEVQQGKSVTLTPTVTPTGASVENLLWTSSNGVVASVTSAGVVKGVKVGTATITVKTPNGLTATCEVTVTAPDATSITLPLTIQTVKQGETLTLTPTLHPSSASTEGLTWASSDETIATVSKGDVKGVAEGTVTITVTTTNGLSATCKVKVVAPDPTAVKLPTETQEVKQGATLKLTPTFEPANATTESLTWTSSNTEVATVSSTGVVTGVKANATEVTITVTTANGKTATCKVKVIAPDPTSISLPTTQEVKKGETITLDPTLKPEGASAGTLTWTTNNSDVASIADATKGEVKGVKEGTATITVKTANGLSAFCVVTVLAPDPTAITLPTETQEVKQGETRTLSPTLEPEGALAENLTWTSDNEAVATVTSSGVVKGVKASDTEVTITVTTANGKSATCKVKVVAPDPTYVSLPGSQEVKKGETVTLTPTLLPENASTSTLTWESSDDAIATVTSEGKVEGKAVGTATITVKTANGKSATCQVRVVQPDLTDITLPTETQEVKQGETLDLTTLWTLTPADASTAGLEWSSSDEAIATVTSSGVVKGVKVNDAEVTITVKTTDGSISKECKVKVVAPEPLSVSLPTTLKVKVGGEETLTPEYTPSDATSTLTWESSDDAIATVSEGKVEGKAEGSATIKVTTANGKTASCLVTVVPADPVDPTTITLPTETQEVKQGETLDLKEKWTLDPADASTANLEWTSSNEAVATVSDGVVTGVKADAAEVTISVKVKGSTEEAKTCKVKVLPPDPTFVSLPTTQKVKKGEKLTLTPTVKPADVSTENFEWTSDKAEVATVEKGEVTGVAEGTATITVKTPNGLTTFCVVTVIPADPVDPTTITLPTATQEVKQGETLDLKEKWTLDPTDASSVNLEWSSSDETIATVSDGVVTGVKADDAEVTISVKVKGSDAALATCKVKVTVPDLASISLPESAEVKKDGTLDLAAELTLTPDNAAAPTVTWTSADDAVATVTAAGVVTGKSLGTVKITAKVSDEISAECEVTVVAPDLTKIELPATVKMCVGDTKDLAAELTLTPADAETPNVTWTTSDKNVARVVSGVVIALNLGTATITATTEDGLTVQTQVIVSEDPDIAALDNALYVEVENVKADATSFELPVFLKNDVTAVGTSFTVTLPAGMTLATDEDGDVTAQLEGTRAAAADFNVLAAGANGSYNVSIMPKGTTEAISGTDGKLLTFTVNVPEGVEVGSYTVRLTSSMLTVKADDGTLSTLELANTSATFNVVPALAGDVNNDGKVDVTDATMIVYAALGEEQEGFDSSSADVNQDGRVDLTDAIIVLYQSLGEDPLKPKSSRHYAAATNSNDALVIDDVVIERGGIVELPVKFANPDGDKIVGMQMTLVLPEGVSTVKDEEELPMAVLDGTSCPKMSLYPTSNDAFGLLPTTLNASVKGSEGTLFTTTLRADDSLEAGSVLETTVTGAVFTVKDASGTYSVPVPDFTFSIVVGDGADAIANIAGVQENGEARFSLSGQRVGNGYKGIVVMKGKKVLVK